MTLDIPQITTSPRSVLQNQGGVWHPLILATTLYTNARLGALCVRYVLVCVMLARIIIYMYWCYVVCARCEIVLFMCEASGLN